MARIEPLLPPSEWPPEMRDALGVLRPEGARHPRPEREGRPKGLNVLGTFARHPALAKAYNTFNGHILFTSTLEPRERELLVLRVAAVRDCEYEWRQHVVQGRDAGLSDEEIGRIRHGADAAGWSALDAAIVRAADELVTDACVSDATWAVLAAELDDEQLIDLVFTVGAYDALAMAMLSFGMELDPDLEEIQVRD